MRCIPTGAFISSVVTNGRNERCLQAFGRIIYREQTGWGVFRVAGNITVKLSLQLINKARRHDDVKGSGGIDPSFLTSALDGWEW
jgi:hypothetical protein